MILSGNTGFIVIGKDPDAGEDWRQEKKGTTEKMIGWHHWLNGHELDQAPGDVKGRKAWPAAVHGFAKSWTRLRHSNNEVTFHHEFMFSLSNSVTLRGSHPTIHWAMTCSKNLFLPHLPTQLLLKSLNLEEDGVKEWKMVKCVWCLGWKHAECVSCKLLLQQTHSGNNDYISSPHLSLLLSLSSSAKSGAKQENKYWVLFQLSLYLPYFNTCNKNHMPVDFNFWTRFCLYLKRTLFSKMSWKLKQDLKGFTWTSDIWLLIRDLPTREA